MGLKGVFFLQGECQLVSLEKGFKQKNTIWQQAQCWLVQV